MAESVSPAEISFLGGLKRLVGHRVRIWYDVEGDDGQPLRETVEGRLDSVQAVITLSESRQIQPSLVNDRVTRTAPFAWLRGYNELNQRTGEVTSTILRSHRSSA